MAPPLVTRSFRVARDPRWASVRARILERDQNTCQCCGAVAVCVDHVLPHSFGGPDSDENLVAACKSCNSAVSNKVFDSFQQKKTWLAEGGTARAERRERKHRRRHSFCACGYLFEPGVDGATTVLCPWCAAVDARRPIPASLQYRHHADGLEGIGVVVPIRPRLRRR